MAPTPASSNIRAYVRWKEPCVYAGEDLECIITFKNISPVAGKDKEQEDQQKPFANGRPRHSRRQPSAASVAHSRRSSIAQSIAPSTQSPSLLATKATPRARGHRPALSLNVVASSARGEPQSAPAARKASTNALQGHGRSISIMSLGSDRANEGPVVYSAAATKRPARSHVRSTSLVTVPSARPSASSYTSPAVPRQPSPLYESTTPPALGEGEAEQLPIRPTRRRPGTVSSGNTPQLPRKSSLPKASPTNTFGQDFHFPARQPRVQSPGPQQESARFTRNLSMRQPAQNRTISPRPSEGWSGAMGNLHPISRVMSESAGGDTPRSSSDMYSTSNHSDETVTSELPYQAHHSERMFRDDLSSRQASISQPKPKTARPETLMMGYAQTMGYFVLDGSLVNSAPFEEVKRKGVQGGGGVVGVDRAKHSSGMFGAFRWGAIGESLGGLLAPDEQSSIAQMKATAGSRSIPLLSTPQNLLFVDLKLAPGESKSFAYRFPLPRGLPPSHKGRAIKVSYYLGLGVQRPEGQVVKRIEVPFRVLGSYNAQGEVLGHDLMSPYILLQDAARSTSIVRQPSTPLEFPASSFKQAAKATPQQGLEDFLRYTERLLEQARHSHNALASPTSPTSPLSMTRTQNSPDQAPATMKEVVDLAIVRANQLEVSDKQRKVETPSANRFNISRAGQPVAILTILRPAYRLGEVVIGTVDFTAPSANAGTPLQIPTYALLIEVESAERVDASLALRSTNSIHRVTRKIHAAVRENTLFARRVSFNLAIPSTATPTFDTTGVSLIWRLRIEFTTQRQSQGPGGDQMEGHHDTELLEELASDERGTTLIAKERLVAETFEIAVPLRVYGTPGADVMSVDTEPLEV